MSADAMPARPEGRGAGGRLTRRHRYRGEAREQLAADLATDYQGGASIRALAASFDLSYGLVRVLLLEAGAELRSRRRRKAEQ